MQRFEYTCPNRGLLSSGFTQNTIPGLPGPRGPRGPNDPGPLNDPEEWFAGFFQSFSVQTIPAGDAISDRTQQFLPGLYRLTYTINSDGPAEIAAMWDSVEIPGSRVTVPTGAASGFAVFAVSAGNHLFELMNIASTALEITEGAQPLLSFFTVERIWWG